MQGRQEYQPRLFSTVNIESLIPKNHLLRKVDVLIDFSFVRELTRPLYCENNGRPSIDPELFLRMQVVCFLYGIKSDRQLCEEVQFNLAYRWFCRLALEEQVPDHSSLTRIRERLGEDIFAKIFDYVVELCRKNGLVRGEKVVVDATLINANASLYSLVERVSLESNEIPADRNHQRKWIKGEKFTNKTHVSRSDPDAEFGGALAARGHLKYKVHNLIDADSRVILDSHASKAGVPDGTVMLDRIKKTNERFDLNIKEISGDRGYGGGENLQALKDRGIKSHIPCFHRDVGSGYDGFEFDKDNDRFKCPAGQFLYPMNTSGDELGRKYRVIGGHCASCPQKDGCKAKARKDSKSRSINVSVFHQIQAETRRQRAQMSSSRK